MTKSILLSIALMFTVVISKAQSIPNAGFETWTAMTGYDNPDSWGCLNSATSSMSTFTCMKGTPGSPGTTYLKLVSKTVTGMGVVPGICVSGKINKTTLQAESGFAYNLRPLNLTGKWQHMVYGISQGFVDIQLTRWDATSKTRKIVASAHEELSGMAMSWASFSIPLTYTDSNNPDSCLITLSASGSTPTNNDYLYIDNLAFAGGNTSISENQLSNTISIYPNPTINNITIDLTSLSDETVTINFFDLQGKQVKSIQNTIATSKTLIDISDLQKGNYFITLSSKEGYITKQITIK